MIIRSARLNNLDKPGVLFFSKFVICLDCGFALVTAPETELAIRASSIS